MEQLHLGVARERITPPIGGQLYGYRPDVFSNAVADDLTVTAFYFQQGNTQALLLSVTVCLIQTALADRIRSLLEEATGINRSACILSATHTHSGPNTCGESGWGEIDHPYCDGILIPAILSAARQAISCLQPVKMGTASGNSLVGINRRELNEENHIVLGQNPWGCFDPRMTVLSFADNAGTPVANLIHYGAHGTAAGTNHEITRDWSGLMVDALEAQSGAITAFFNGPEGDVGPRISNGFTVGDLSYVRELGAVAAQDALRIAAQISSYSDIKLSVSHQPLSIPLKKRMPLPKARELFAEYKHETVNFTGMKRTHFASVVQSYADGLPDHETAEIDQTLIALGDFVFASFPYELFSEIGLRINKALQPLSVLSLSNANGSEGYFVTQDALCRGGYEVEMFLYGHLQQFADDADFHLMRETVAHIQKLNEKGVE